MYNYAHLIRLTKFVRMSINNHPLDYNNYVCSNNITGHFKLHMCILLTISTLSLLYTLGWTWSCISYSRPPSVESLVSSPQ